MPHLARTSLLGAEEGGVGWGGGGSTVEGQNPPPCVYHISQRDGCPTPVHTSAGQRDNMPTPVCTSTGWKEGFPTPVHTSGRARTIVHIGMRAQVRIPHPYAHPHKVQKGFSTPICTSTGQRDGMLTPAPWGQAGFQLWGCRYSPLPRLPPQRGSTDGPPKILPKLGPGGDPDPNFGKK